MRNLLFAFLLVILLCTSMSMQGADLPCFLHQVNRTVESGATVTITGMPAGNGQCQYALNDSLVVVTLQYQLQKQTTTGEFVTVDWPNASYKLDGTLNRRPMLTLANLDDGEYRLLSVNNGNFLEALHFSVGGVADINRLDLNVSYAQPAAIVHGGSLYFRGHLGQRTVASGYLYQGTTQMLPADFFTVDQQDSTLMINQSFVRGGTLDMPWIQVKLQNNNLDPTRPVSACMTVDGGGATTCFVVYDPLSPMKIVTNGFVPSSK